MGDAQLCLILRTTVLFETMAVCTRSAQPYHQDSDYIQPSWSVGAMAVYTRKYTTFIIFPRKIALFVVKDGGGRQKKSTTLPYPASQKEALSQWKNADVALRYTRNTHKDGLTYPVSGFYRCPTLSVAILCYRPLSDAIYHKYFVLYFLSSVR